MNETNDHQPTPPDEERSWFTEPRRQLPFKEGAENEHRCSEAALVFLTTGIVGIIVYAKCGWSVWWKLAVGFYAIILLIWILYAILVLFGS